MPPNDIVLAFDTSAAQCAAALLSGDHCITRIDPMARGQAEHMMPMLEQVLHDNALNWRDLSAIGVGIGPGNFTGIRIAVSAARGLALGLGVPAIGVSTLEAQAYEVSGPVLSCTTAPRGRAYVQVFDQSGTTEPALIDPATDAFRAGLQDGFGLLGDATDLIAPHVAGAKVVPQPLATVDCMARITRARMGSVQPRATPLYIRAPDAAPPRKMAPRVVR